MIAHLKLLTSVVVSLLKSKGRLEAEVVLLRHQLNVLRRTAPRRLRLTSMDRLIFVWLYRLRPSLLNAVGIIRPATVLRWHRGGFRPYWRWKSRSPGGRPKTSRETRQLIREMSVANPLDAPSQIRTCSLEVWAVSEQQVAKSMRPVIFDLCAYRKLFAAVLMVQATEDRNRSDTSGSLDGAGEGAVLPP
jgi:hypothetical protein